MALDAGVLLISGSPRFPLAKDGWLTGAWAAWFLASLLTRRPATFVFARPLLEGRRVFDPAARTWAPPVAQSWDELWDQVPAFRRAWRVTTVIWGAAMLADAVIRITMAWTLPIDAVPALGAALWPVTFIMLQVITNVYFHRTGLGLILRAGPAPRPCTPPQTGRGAKLRPRTGRPVRPGSQVVNGRAPGPSAATPARWEPFAHNGPAST